MSGPGVTSACIFSFWIDMPVCDPPFGNETHLPHSGRMHSCPNTDVLATIAAKMIKPRIHFLLCWPPGGAITWFGTACTWARLALTHSHPREDGVGRWPGAHPPRLCAAGKAWSVRS